VKTSPIRLAVTPGEPAGIGPDLCLQLAQETFPWQWVVVANKDLLLERARQLGLSIKLIDFDPNQMAEPHVPGEMPVLSIPLAEKAEAGVLNPANAPYVLACLDAAVDLCTKDLCQALVTGPVHKGVINETGVAFSGHTEYLALRTHGHPVMMLATEGLRVALVTTHLPLKDVPAAITRETLEQVITTLHRELQNHFGMQEPKILVCGLNPHAGEDGHLGREEIDVIEPVLNELRHKGWHLEGPLPADTLFTPERIAHCDAVLAMYHDQGLPVLKHMGFGEAVNITLGLPIIRVSVDHGTALERAGTGDIQLGSLRLAMKTAVDMAQRTN
jgi:4-hydroxythreonine-4-phosphate dehydrogenase